MDLRQFIETKFLCWVLIVTRTAGMFTIAPFFGDWFLPVQTKILLVIFLGWTSLPAVNESIALNTPVLQIVLAIFSNYTFGLAIGFLALLPIVAMSVSGEIFGTQMGFAMSSVFDPQREEVPLQGELLYMLGLYVFVALKGHLLVYQAIVDSLRVVPLSKTITNFDFVNILTSKTTEMFEIAMKIGLPMIGFMLVVSIALGIISRLVPQMNVFMVGMPLKVLVGLILFAGMIPIWADVFSQIANKTLNFLNYFVQTFSK
ncbi:MAG TPA: flagellar biosynthetic protein FliR [Pseudothermotoga sp.]